MSEENESPNSSYTVSKQSSESEIGSSSSTKDSQSSSLNPSLNDDSKKPSSPEEKQKMTPQEAISEFYRLKNKYESVYYDKYIKPILKNNKSKREKRVEFSRLPKHECINCKRNVGTIFNISLDKDMVRNFVAKCGDLSDPCPLDIQITSGYRQQFDSAIHFGLKIVERIKLDIIKEKNNALFFNKNVVSTFEELTEKLKKELENTGFIIETNILKNDNPEKKALLNKTIDEFGKGCIIPFKQMINEFMEKNNELKLNEAINFYINEMTPKLQDIQSLKYNVNYVEYQEKYNPTDSIRDVYKLIQLPNSLENTETYIESDDKVIKFVMGVKKGKKAKTMKLGVFGTNKTRKIRSSNEFIIEGEDEEQEETAKLVSKESSEGLEGVPDFDAPGGVKWNNEKYNQIWGRLPSKLKDVLQTDEEWTQEYVSRCVASKNQKQPCRLFLPKQTIIPPKKLEDGTYDFGVEVLNRIFNKQDEQHKHTLLTWTEDKYAKNNYASFKELFVSLLEKALDLDIYSYGYGYS